MKCLDGELNGVILKIYCKDGTVYTGRVICIIEEDESGSGERELCIDQIEGPDDVNCFEEDSIERIEKVYIERI